eukprot:7245167-Alexandrium_andersonii.AAC.1
MRPSSQVANTYSSYSSSSYLSWMLMHRCMCGIRILCSCFWIPRMTRRLHLRRRARSTSLIIVSFLAVVNAA